MHGAGNVLLDEQDSEGNSSQILQQHRNGLGSNGVRVGSPALSELNTRNMGAQFHAPSHGPLIPEVSYRLDARVSWNVLMRR